MTPNQIKLRRLELGLTVAELANALQITENELLQIETGKSALYESKAFEEAFECLEEIAFGTYAGA
jgi:transcriptional regulator with XRE-family HTH domain